MAAAILVVLLFCAASLFSAVEGVAAQRPPNVLFLVVDDLRPKLGCYGESNMVTPNIDQLASRSVRFDRAYVQEALCAPSRGSFLTGRRPDTTRVLDIRTYFRTVAGNFTTLPQHFKNHGYITQSVGKIFHPGRASGGTDDYPYSWTNFPYHPPALKHEREKTCPGADGALHKYAACPVNVSTTPGKVLADMQSADFAINFLHNMTTQRDQPFFLAVGFHKPHLPFRFPKEYLDLYPLWTKIHLANDSFIPEGLPPPAWNPFFCIRHYQDVARFNLSAPWGVVPNDYQVKLRQAYSAAASYTDGQLGRVLQALDQAGFANNTIISFNGDHGWSLGEHQEWCKFSNFEIATRIPLLFYMPGVTSAKSPPGKTFPFIDPLDAPQGSTVHRAAQGGEGETGGSPKATPGANYHSDALVEAVDIYPTLSELAGLPVPQTCPQDSMHTEFCSEGSSLAPLIRDVTRRATGVGQGGAAPEAGQAGWKDAVFSQYPRPSFYPGKGSDMPNLAQFKIMGYTMRTNEYRYTEWLPYDPNTFTANWSQVLARELYVHATDPLEDWNQAEVPSQSSLVAQLSQKLRGGWRQALPTAH